MRGMIEMNSYHANNATGDADHGELDALYAAWRDDRNGPNPTPLRLWLARVPAYADTLVEWTTDAALTECADALPEDPALVARTVEIGERSLSAFRDRKAAHTQPALTSLKEAAARRGITLKTLADSLELGLPLVAKLEQRLLRLESLPARLIDRLADSLQVSTRQVRAYLGQPPKLSSAALYRADAAPRTGAQEEFEHAIKTCAGMTAAQKQAWLDAE